MKEVIGDSDSYVADVKELKERHYIDNEFGNFVGCALCNNTSDNHNLWFILKDAGCVTG